MPIAYEIDAANSIVRVRLTGSLRLDEVVRAVEALLGDPGLEPGTKILSDHSGLEEIATTSLVKSVVPLLERLAERLGPFRCAVLAPRDASYGMARMAGMMAEWTRAEVCAFRTLDQAEEWLLQRPSSA